jgi:hypothetical protein
LRSLRHVTAASAVGASLGLLGRAGEAESLTYGLLLLSAVLVALAQQTLP